MEIRGGFGFRAASTVVLLLLLFLIPCRPVSALERINEVRPEITAVFSEAVVLIGPYFLRDLDNPGHVVEMDMVFQKDGRTFVFVPREALSNAHYIFDLYAQDLVGNPEMYTFEFEVSVPGTSIRLVEPNGIGVANSTVFRVTIETSRPSVCKYTGSAVASYTDMRLRMFDITGNESLRELVEYHSVLDFSVNPSFPQPFFVACKDDLGRVNFRMFRLESDTIPPRLTYVGFDPARVLEYPVYGDLTSVLGVTASEGVLCRYTEDPAAPYQGMDPFPGYDEEDYDSYVAEHAELISFEESTIKESFDYYVQCMDRAGFFSEKVQRTVEVDLTEGLKVNVHSPKQFSKETRAFLNVSTNKRAYCVYKSATADTGDPTSWDDPKSALSSSVDHLSTSHWKDIGTKPPGTHTITIRCMVPLGVGEDNDPVEITYAYTIDTRPPTQPSINVTTPVCDHVLSASFSATDEISGISLYVWAVGSAGSPFAEGNTTGTSVTVDSLANGSALILQPGLGYYFSVAAVDGAGNMGPAGSSESIEFDDTGINCDSTPPTVTVIRSEELTSVSLFCEDSQSGCSSLGSFYGTSSDAGCNATQYFLEPVVIPLFRSTYVCWDIKDNADNHAIGSQLIDLTAADLNLTPGEACVGGIDNDGDGYGERCLLGADCDDTDPDQAVGCANGCIQDLDGDGYGLGCENGDDCNGQDAALNEVCPNNCISDNDGDEYGLGCDNGPDCKGDDSTLRVNCPSGCIDDNDGDGFGIGCPAGFDCHGEDRRQMTVCDNNCIQDTDGDGFGIGCAAGLDCDGGHPDLTDICENGCIFDEDSDGYGFGCTLGNDCNGMNPFRFEGCANMCESDNDGDASGWGCNGGADCNDTDPFVDDDCLAVSGCIYDHDGDGYGPGCELGADCFDYDPLYNTDCEMNCSFDEDCNGLPDMWQEQYFNDTVCNESTFCDAAADPDEDGYTNIEEYRRGTNPLEKEAVQLPPELPPATEDTDGDGMSDECERLYDLDYQSPDDAMRDYDSDGLTNRFECQYREGRCRNSFLSPISSDHDNDGYLDPEELDAGTDPCDPDSRPSKAWIGLVLVILGLLMILGSTGYLVYKKYYIPLVTPPPKAAVPAQPARAPVHRPAPTLGARHHVPRRAPPRPTGPVMSREAFESEMKKRAEERERVLKAFGERRERPRKVMEKLAARPKGQGIARRAAAAPAKAKAGRAEPTPPPKDDYVSRLTHVVGKDYFDKISDLSKKEADYMGRLATIAKEKDVAMADDHVSKLARITRKVSEDPSAKRRLETAFKKSGEEELDSFLSSRKHVDTFIKEAVTADVGGPAAKTAAAGDDFDKLAGIAGKAKGGFDALDELSKAKRKDVISSLEEMSSKKAQKTALSKIETLSGAGSKEEIFKAFEKMGKDAHMDKNVFEVLLSYLLKSGKITRHDVHGLLLDLEQQGVLSKKDVADVFMNLGMKDMPL